MAETQKDYPDKLPDRVRKNLAVVGLGLALYNEHVEEWGGRKFVPTQETFDNALDNVLLRLSDGTSRTMVDDFVEDVVAHVANDDNLRIPFLCFYQKPTNVLWIHLSSTLHWWQKDQRYRGKSSLDILAMRAQMVERTQGDAPYVVKETLLETPGGRKMNCFGLRMGACHKAGLEVPDSLNSAEMVIRSRLLKS
jgi:hypothetical protein